MSLIDTPAILFAGVSVKFDTPAKMITGVIVFKLNTARRKI
jgi:hypothetical protein